MSALQKNKSTQTSGSVPAERIENVKKTKFELELIKTVDCFLDGHGCYDSNLVSSKIKTLCQTIFLLQLVRIMSVPKEYKMIVKNEIKNQKNSNLVRFQNENFTTCHILNQVLYTASDFETKFSQRVRF